MARLIFTGEKFRGRVYEFALLKTTVGRGDHNTLAIHDASVSQTHCEVLVFGPEVIVRDLGSTNGTFVNGRRLCNQQCEIKPGETVRFGLVEARLELEQASFSDTATSETGFHSYARHLHDPQEESGIPANVSMTLEPGLEKSPPDHTLALPPPSHADEVIARQHPARPQL